MFRKAKKNYLELNVRVSYDENDDAVRVIAKDKSLPKHRSGVRLELDSEGSAEQSLREMLMDAGIITEDHIIPSKLHYDEIVDSRWDEFTLGKAGGTKTVIWNPNSSAHLLLTGPAGSGKSVLERNIIFHCLQHPDKWRVLGVDFYRVELSPYEKYSPAVLGIAKDLEDAVEACRFAREEMYNRYGKMEELGVNNYQDLPDAPYGLIFIIDEVSHLLALSGVKSEEGKAEDELRNEAALLLRDIARLGRAAGIHLVIASQRPDSSILNAEFKANMYTKIVMGRVDSLHSQLVLGNEEATQMLPLTFRNGHYRTVRGRGYIQDQNRGQQFQSAYAETDWYDKWLKKNNIDWYKDDKQEPTSD
jgi:S-DNA-T family DNA segregation ATPase FtsK/SpoIIIE